MDDVLRVKSYSLALRVVKLYKYLQDEHKEYVLSKQVLTIRNIDRGFDKRSAICAIKKRFHQ